jgi:peptide/nickel transport system substrate-binding protein
MDVRLRGVFVSEVRQRSLSSVIVNGPIQRRFLKAPVTTLMVLGLVALGLSCGLSRDAASTDPTITGPDSPYLGATTSDDPPTYGGRLVYGLPGETNSWNPSVAQWPAYSMQVARALFDTLYLFDADGTVRPNVVARSEHNEDYTVWTTTIRRGIRFHNGKPVTAADIVKSQEYHRKSPVLGGVYALAHIERSEVIDEHTFRTYSTKPWPTAREQATTQLSVVVDVDWLSSPEFDKPIGTGPFMVEHWELGNRMVVTRNPDYWRTDRWGNRLPYLDKIEFRVIPDDRARAMSLVQGEIDLMMQTLATPGIASLRERCRRGELQCFSDEKGEIPEDYVVLNTSKPPFDDLDARRAMAMAIDRRDFVERVTGGVAEPADGMYHPSSPWWTPSVYPDYDPEEAARLAEVVRERNGGVFRFELMAVASEDALRITHYLQDAWRKVGIEAVVTTTDNRTKIINQVTGAFEASLTQLFDAQHPTGITAYLDPGQTEPGQLTMVFSRLDDDELGERIDDLLRADPTPQNWKVANGRLMDRLNELVPFLWLDHSPRTIVARPNIVNIVQATLPDGEIAQDFHLGSHAVSQMWIRRP